MTMLGGKLTTLNASLADEWGVPPVGSQYNFNDGDVEWIGKPVTEDGKRETAASRQ